MKSHTASDVMNDRFRWTVILVKIIQTKHTRWYTKIIYSTKFKFAFNADKCNGTILESYPNKPLPIFDDAKKLT